MGVHRSTAGRDTGHSVMTLSRIILIYPLVPGGDCTQKPLTHLTVSPVRRATMQLLAVG